MFSIDVMSSASEWYYLSMVNYYLRRRSRKRRRRGKGDVDLDDDDGFDPDPDESLLGDASPYTIQTPGEPPGQWFGAGAEALGLAGIVREEEYHRVFRGFHPQTEKPLVQNAGRPKRRAGWEACLSVPKAVSVLWSQLSPADRERLQAVVWKAAKSTISFIEQTHAFSRAGKASEGCQLIPVGLVVAMFEHASSRAKDPDLHIHAQILNLGVDLEGHVRALETKAIFENQAVLSNYFRAQVAAGLQAEFGVVTRATSTGFTIEGVPPELVEHYSKRRQAILDYMEEHKLHGPAAAAVAALATRDKKDSTVSRQELFNQWQAINAKAGFDDKYVAQLISFCCGKGVLGSSARGGLGAVIRRPEPDTAGWFAEARAGRRGRLLAQSFFLTSSSPAIPHP